MQEESKLIRESNMYGEVQGTSVAPVVVSAGTVAVLPSTGMDFVLSLALAVAAGLVAWGAVYYLQAVRTNR